MAAVIGAGVLGVGRWMSDRCIGRRSWRGSPGREIGDEVTPELAARVLMSADGGRKGVPKSAEFVVLVSGAGRNLEGSRALASAVGGRVVVWDVGSGLLEVGG